MKEPKVTGSACKCTVCGKVFGGERSFDQHRVGEYGKHPAERQCLTEDELAKIGIIQSPKTGRWGKQLPPDTFKTVHDADSRRIVIG